jgi:L-ascorbate metabolism protein UlaG (beta-lactamase superfamily)
MYKLLKMTGLIILTILVLTGISITLFVYWSPQFGGEITKELKADYSKSKNWNSGNFVNQIPTSMDIKLKDYPAMIAKLFSNAPGKKPKKDISVLQIDSLSIANKPKSLTRITWFGHSAFLLEINGKNILLDPMFGEVAAPHPYLGRKRYNSKLPIEIEKLPQIDAVIMSHDHYDHLDYESILKLKDKANEFYMPLGVGRHFKKWGIDQSKIHELDWWQDIQLEELTLVCTPARHFSGRGLTDRSTTLWSSWVILSGAEKIYFSGDSGYGPHFKEIGGKYGPFDFAMIECGQYNEQWSAIHMMPEQTAQAAVDLKAMAFMPIHWGAFTLAFHSWTDPIERVSAKVKELGLDLSTPRIGEPVILGKAFPKSTWWKGL